jgi:hypothetical protein
MKAIRRSLGAFAVAAVMATTLLALTPSEAQARKVDFCDALRASIEAITALPDSPFKDYILAHLNQTLATYCQE